MKKIYISSILIAILFALFYLLEPLISYNVGWTKFPNTSGLQPVIQHQALISKKADSVLIAAYTQLNTPALSIAIGKDNKIIWSNAIGYKDIKKNKKVSLNTKFRIGSTSKAVTSIGLGILLQDKELTLDSRVQDYVPYASESYADITVRQLASHTSGIRNYGLCFCFPIWEYYGNDEYLNTQESVSIFNDAPLLFDPGTGFSYSTYNYTLLSAVMEGVSKTDFSSFMKTSLFDPLEIDISIEKEPYTSENVSAFYEIKNNTFKEAFEVDNSYKWAGGGFIASPTALATLGNAFLNHSILNKKITTSLIEPVSLKNGQINEQYYAMGWRNHTTEPIFNNKEKVRILHHAGTANGSTSVFILFPEYNISISVLINKSSSTSELFDVAYKLFNIFYTNTTTLRKDLP